MLTDSVPGEFECQLFVDARPELALIPADVRAPLIEQQLTAQRRQQAISYPNAIRTVLYDDSIPVGLLVCDTAGPGAPPEAAIHLLDISVLAAHRGRGIGSDALLQLQTDAAGQGRDITLHVWAANHAARRLYERLGFSYASSSSADDLHISMRWNNRITPRKDPR